MSGSSIDNNDFLRFSAYSMKELITRKLTADTKFTDQVYEGSNLAILIDIVSYMYQCLLYSLNKSAAEAMFSDTQIYENINRLCKFIGYNPKGCSPATVQFVLDNAGETDENGDSKFWKKDIPKYAYIDTGKTDSNGKQIQYSTITSHQVPNSKNYQVLFYNGMWKLYPTVYTGTGEAYQTLYLDAIGSDAAEQKFVTSEYMDVYVWETDKYVQWTKVDYGVFADDKLNNGSPIYGNSDRIFCVRLNENKTYEIQFGSGSVGRVPAKGAPILVMYLDTNGEGGAIDAGAVTDGRIAHSAAAFGMDEETYSQLFGGKRLDDDLASAGIWRNISNSSTFCEEEGVDDIRRNAPEWFKTGNRLVTAADWEYFVKNQFKDNILDVVCQNNWAFMTSFYRWLYNLGVKEHDGDSRYYLNQNKVSKYTKYADAADCNNVYLWIKMKNDAEIYRDVINTRVQNIKMLTQQPVYVKPLDVYFAISAEDAASAREKYFGNTSPNNDSSFDPDNKSYLEVTINDDILYSNVDIKNQIVTVIEDFFKEEDQTLGQTVNGNRLLDKILELNSVTRVRTVYRDETTGEEQIYSGISFATWTSDFINLGDDLEVSSGVKVLEPF